VYANMSGIDCVSEERRHKGRHYMSGKPVATQHGRVVWQRFRVAPGRGPSAWEWLAVPVEASGWRRAKELQ
jgi:hypothetical protein